MGCFMALSMTLGVSLAVWPIVAIAAIALLAFGSVQLATRSMLGGLVMTLGVPLAAIGFSYPGIGSILPIAVILAVGSLVATVISMFFGETKPSKAATPRLLPQSIAPSYGLLFAITAVVASSVAFLLGIEHVGWVAGAALLIFRPNPEVLEGRALYRVASVTVGALLAVVLVSLQLPVWLVAILAPLGIVGAALTAETKQYIMPFFTTYVVLWVLQYGVVGNQAVADRFFQRVLETLLGVGIGVTFGYIVPWLLRRIRRPNPS